MQRHELRVLQNFCAAFLAGILLLGSTVIIQAAEATPPIPGFPPVGAVPVPSSANAELLQWDATIKELAVKAGQATADFTFSVTNVSTSDVVIDRLQPSCGCTTAKLPTQPWRLAPHADGQISVSVNLAGKSGTIFKTVTVISTNAAKTLTLKVIIPEDSTMARNRNQEMAKADRQAVFKNDCASCHVEKAKGKVGQELYAAACGICHDAEHRDSKVPNLHALNHSTDYNYWKAWITAGKAGTMMPAFAIEQGGPLSGDQIASVAKYLSETVPANPQSAQLNVVNPIPTK